MRSDRTRGKMEVIPRRVRRIPDEIAHYWPKSVYDRVGRVADARVGEDSPGVDADVVVNIAAGEGGPNNRSRRNWRSPKSPAQDPCQRTGLFMT